MKILRTDGSSWEELETNIELGVGDYLFEVFRVWDGYLYAGTAGPNDRPDSGGLAHAQWNRVAEDRGAPLRDNERSRVHGSFSRPFVCGD